MQRFDAYFWKRLKKEEEEGRRNTTITRPHNLKLCNDLTHIFGNDLRKKKKKEEETPRLQDPIT